MATDLEPRSAYVIAERIIDGSHEERLEQIDEAIRELCNLKKRECGVEDDTVGFLPGVERQHWFAMGVTILVLLIALVLLLGSQATQVPYAVR